ncbi:FadR/GntR family transcriptional regulator [Acetohalobium arabaticum]|uniref:GntR domain protein n=1 Tax=Acetohalobium arabaticum (strain ATCC 49924 / DSM 5501 / Z-7288) TaxID=574087 RepID=D9QS17_ACEAZ|nr:FadR/GntR family transcriptional regulator [Acetohalobium arabaticum]ADL13308.1 GntR domain protein [Acetohalobium arabaticum DSM 5501]
MSIFKPIKNKRIYQQIIEQVRELIADGTLEPGDKLMSERAMAEKLDVSRASIREAFSVLEMLGLIESRPGEGTFITDADSNALIEPLALVLMIDQDNVFELLEIRKIIEVGNAGLAAERATDEKLKEMKEALSLMRKQRSTGEMASDADFKFHFAVAKGTGNKILVKIMHVIADLLYNSIGMNLQQMYKVEGNSEMIIQQHKNIYKNIMEKNVRGAKQAMYHHLEAAREEILWIIKESNRLKDET